MGLVVAFARAAQPPAPDPAVLSHLLLFCVFCGSDRNSQRLFGASIPFPQAGLFHPCQKVFHGAGEHSPAAPWGEEEKGGLTWAHSVLWGVLLGAGSAEKCVLWKPWVCTVLWLCLVGCACPFLRAHGCHCVLLGAVS